MKVSFVTVGCRMNQFDTDLLRSKFFAEGYEVGEGFEKADVYVINTCTVTSGGDRSSRQAIFRAKRKNPDAIVVATGCLAQVRPDQLASIPEVDLIIGNTHKSEIVKILEDYLSSRKERVHVGEIFREKRLKNFDTVTYFEGSRPFIKIQEGCNRFCTFCVIPFARGKVRSADPQRVVDQVRILADMGFGEVVLSGTQLSQYGWDLGTSLYQLLLELIKTDISLIRLSSMHIGEMDDNLIDLITSEEKIAPHFHLSLQSGSDKILERMGRGYTLAEYSKIVEKIVVKRPPSAVGTDIIAGFPGEGEREFGETLKAVKELPFAYIHVFPYSDRPFTRSQSFGNKVRETVKKDRVAILREVDCRKREEFLEKNRGRRLRAVVLNSGKVLTENYIELLRETGQKPGKLVTVEV